MVLVNGGRLAGPVMQGRKRRETAIELLHSKEIHLPRCRPRCASFRFVSSLGLMPGARS
jgi:hypothetical protein